VFLVCSVVALPSAQKLKAEDVVKRHLDAQFPEPARSADHERTLRGTCRTTSPAKVAGTLDGSFSFASSPQSSKLAIQFPSDVYTGEDFSVTGDDVNIGFAQPRTSSRSALGVFLAMNRVIVGEGLIGGALNGRWPLLDPGVRQAKLSYDGLKKQGGKDLHRVRYRAKQGQGQLDIYLFFEPETFRHVASTYSYSQAQSMGPTMESSSQRSETYYRIEESFGDFQQAGGFTLPKSWMLRYERSGDTSTEWKYEFTVQSIQPAKTAH
jgi:hypothetical protein